MALTEAKGSLEEQARAARFSAQLFEEKERQAAELAAMTSEQRVFEDEDGNAWDYVVIAERVVRIEGCSEQVEELCVPAQIEGLPVIAVAAEALAGKTAITEVHFPESVEQIGAYVLRGCSQLRVADLACSADRYDPSWLKGCAKVEELRVPENATSLKPNIFDLPQLKRLYLGRGMEELEPGMFAKSKLDSIQISAENTALRTDGAGIYSADGSCFVALAMPRESYAVKPGVTKIAKKAFAGIGALAQVEIPQGLELLDEFALARTAITSFTAPESLRCIGRQAFFNCRELAEVTLNEGLEEVGDEAFCASGITRLQLPRTIRELGKKVVDRTALKCSGADASFSIEEGSQAIRLDEYGVLYAIEEEGLRVIRGMDTSLPEIELLDGTYKVGEGAFTKQMNLRRVVLPEGLLYIEDNAFRDCRGLEQVSVPSTLRSVGDNAFLDTSIAAFKVPAGLERIGRTALITLGAHHEDWAPELELVEVDPANPRFYKHCGMLVERRDDGHAQVLVYDGTEPVVFFPDEVDTVCPYAFRGTKKLQELHISDRVKAIGMRGLAFDCLLKDIYIECTQPIEGHSKFHFSFPDTKRGEAQQNNAFGQLQNMDVEFIFRGYDLTITNAAKFDNKSDDDLALYDQVCLLVERLEDPLFLRPVHQDTIDKMFTFNIVEICKAVARHDDRGTIDKLVELGYLNKENVYDVTDAVAELKDAAMTGHMLELIRRRFGLDTARFEI